MMGKNDTSRDSIQALLLDFGGTLDNDGVDWFTRLYRRIAERTGPIDPAEFRGLADQAAAQIAGQPDTPQLSMEQTAERLCRYLQLLAQEQNGCGWSSWDPAAVAADFMDEARPFLQRNRRVLDQLRRRYRLGVISNNWGNTAGWCRQFDLSGFLEVVIDSTVVGVAKPNPEIFHRARQALDLPAGACAYVGDWYASDMIGAHRAGLATIWLRPDDKAQTEDGDIIDYQIHRLSDLVNLDLSGRRTA
ncbi:MAG: HAD family hydrolase [Sedimentisphaerales bacterium]|nr:HAD family hydrolase [Sedimentisphaerales bacterium]